MKNDIWVAKLGEYGKIEWAKSYGGDKNERSVSIEPTTDSCYVLAGQSLSRKIGDTGHYGMGDVWVLKLDDTGGIRWQKNYGGTNTDIAKAIHVTSGGSYAFVGSTRSRDMDIKRSFGDEDLWVMSLGSKDGKILALQTHGSIFADAGMDIIESKNKRLYVPISVANVGGATSDFWLIFLGSLAQEELYQQKTIGSGASDTCYNIIPENDTSYLLAGHIGAGNGDAEGSGYHGKKDIWLVKLSFLTGVEGLKADNGINVYPTITNGLVSIDLPETYRKAEVSIMNSTGQRIEVAMQGTDVKRQLNLQDIPTGVYYVYIATPSSAYMYRIVYQQ